MEEKKHIDRIFQEQLKGFEAMPDPAIWQNIEQELHGKKKRRIIPIWLKVGGIAAAIALLFTTSLQFFNQQDKHPVKVNEQNNKVDETPISTKSVKQDIQNQESETVISSTTNNGKVDELQETEQINKRVTKSINSTQSNSSSNTFLASANTKIVDEKEVEMHLFPVKENNKIKAFLIKNEVVFDENSIKNTKKTQKRDIFEVFQENELADKNTEETKKWSVGTLVAPVSFNTLRNGSPIHSSLASNGKKANTNLSYGVKVNYQLNKRLSVQSGVNSVNLGYTTENVYASLSSSKLVSANTSTTNLKNINLISLSGNNSALKANELSANIASVSGDLNQTFQYFEVPVEAKYALIQKKIGVNFVGGVSTYFLHKNNVSIENQNSTTSLGEASNLNSVNFSGNVGLDVDYKFNKNLFINVSPVFKYQMNTFSENDGGFMPYSFGVYTGLNFRF